MAGLSSPGLGSGLDVSSMVSQLVAAERAPAQERITRDQKRIDSHISALGQLKGGLAALKSALESLKSEASFQTRAATSADVEIFTAAATSSAASGQYDVEIEQLATAHKLASGPFLNGAMSVVGTGALTIELGDESFDIVIGDDANTLGAIRDAINSAGDNPGVRATIVQADDGARLILTSNKTGAEQAIRVTAAGGDGGLDALVYDPGVLENLDELIAAQDAVVRIDGFVRTSASNTVTGALDGVTLTLLQETPENETLSLTIANDAKAATDKVQKFVTAFNSLATTIGTLRAYNPDTRVAGPLVGDSMLRGIDAELRRIVSDAVPEASEAYNSLAMIGVTTGSDGALKIDQAKLANAFAADFDAIGRLFGSEDGVGARLFESLDNMLNDDAALTKRAEGLQVSKRAIATRTDALDARMQIIQQRYLKQFTALDTLLSQLQSTSSYLVQQLANM